MTGSKPRNSIEYQILFLIKIPYAMCLQNDTYIVQLTYDNMNRLKKSCSWLCGIIIMSFLRWMSLQSNKIALVDFYSKDM